MATAIPSIVGMAGTLSQVAGVAAQYQQGKAQKQAAERNLALQAQALAGQEARVKETARLEEEDRQNLLKYQLAKSRAAMGTSGAAYSGSSAAVLRAMEDKTGVASARAMAEAGWRLDDLSLSRAKASSSADLLSAGAGLADFAKAAGAASSAGGSLLQLYRQIGG
ncbi:hypothetical protein FACS1894186_3240 [Alphaproteobacteria bacterium]|nr:hypothetical protein FACS1894186_3240 [Alphaproteobacteria bacterium]